MKITTRLMSTDDDGFIYNSWLKSCRGDMRKVGTKDFYAAYTMSVQSLLAKDHVRVHVACDPDDESFIYGYIAASDINGVPVVHYAYTKNSFRNFGVFRELLSKITYGKVDDPIVITYWPKGKEAFLRKFNFIYKPELREV